MMRMLVLAPLAAVLLAAAAPAATVPTVHIRNYAFNPAKLTVHAGTTVVFVNDDDEAHTVTADDHAFDSGGMDTGDKFKRTFSKPGSVAYHCTLHPTMKAQITVVP